MKIKMAIAAAMFLCSAVTMRAQTAPSTTTKPKVPFNSTFGKMPNADSAATTKANAGNARSEMSLKSLRQSVSTDLSNRQENSNKDQKATNEQVTDKNIRLNPRETKFEKKAEDKKVNRDMNEKIKKINRDQNNEAKGKKDNQ